MQISEEVREFLMVAIEEEMELTRMRRATIKYYNELVDTYNLLDKHKQVKLKACKPK